jgi:hypothetical protein
MPERERGWKYHKKWRAVNEQRLEIEPEVLNENLEDEPAGSDRRSERTNLRHLDRN